MAPQTSMARPSAAWLARLFSAREVPVVLQLGSIGLLVLALPSMLPGLVFTGGTIDLDGLARIETYEIIIIGIVSLIPFLLFPVLCRSHGGGAL